MVTSALRIPVESITSRPVEGATAPHPDDPSPDDHIAEAYFLLTAGHAGAAAMVARVALEVWLRAHTVRLNCTPTRGASGIFAHARSLVEVGFLTPADLSDVRVAAKTGHRAAHGNRISRERVAVMLANVDWLFAVD